MLVGGCYRIYSFTHSAKVPGIIDGPHQHEGGMEITMIGAYMGMILVLAAFIFETRGLLSSRSLLYLYSMGIGETMLTIRAGVTGEWPFAILGAIWAVFALYSVLRPIKVPDENPLG
ncbi:MAG: hypothetical protein CMA69_02380 [Euryarchaeota archaeon]|nr:hypothetical protein [Euryarchaeota archaeon]|tara:strand:- start:268 stop:618 length:351 start_codon:yes stop_codon:yes gene_type:complete